MCNISWIFGYGSLMWDPGFAPAEVCRARLSGYARSFCLLSVHYRGTEADPGLVLALDADAGAECAGMAMRIPEGAHDAVIADLRARELLTGAYREVIVPVRLDDGRQVDALTFVMRRDHAQYAGALRADQQAGIIARAAGGRGPNADYLFNTVRYLTQIGMPDPTLTTLADQVRTLLSVTKGAEISQDFKTLGKPDGAA